MMKCRLHRLYKNVFNEKVIKSEKDQNLRNSWCRTVCKTRNHFKQIQCSYVGYYGLT